MKPEHVRSRTVGNAVPSCLSIVLLGSFIVPAAMAATPILSVSDFNSTVGNSTSTVSPHSHGNTTVTATQVPLVLANLGGNLTYTGTSLMTGTKLSGANSVAVNSTSSQRVQFSLGLNDAASVSLTGGYSLNEAVLTASSMTWSLIGPGNVILFSGGTATAATGSINQSLSRISGQGTYTLLLSSTLNGTANSPSLNLATASFTAVNFSVTTLASPVPEPNAAAMLGMAGSGLLIFHRRGRSR
ncbi:MAG: hypothetical protein EOP88_15435 [Verrucomicrobiaceae bacterium]|nr:MAG: hypothetical protein EOP88_15435 [Verrucomicrobiaceae bacterium]